MSHLYLLDDHALLRDGLRAVLQAAGHRVVIPQDMQLGRPGHLGVVGMRERSISIGARFSVTGANGGGTRVSLHWEAPRS